MSREDVLLNGGSFFKEWKEVKERYPDILPFYGVISYFNKEYRYSSQILNEVVRESNDDGFFILYGNSLLLSGDYRDAAVILENLSYRISDKRDFLLYLAGTGYFLSQDMKKARELYSKVEGDLKEKSNILILYSFFKEGNLDSLFLLSDEIGESPFIKYLRGLFYIKRGMYRKGIQELRKVEDEEIKEYAQLSMAFGYLKSGKTEYAKKILLGLRESDMRNIYLSRCYENENKLDSGIIFLKRAISNYPESEYRDYIFFSLSLLYIKKKDYKNALYFLRSLVSAFPNSVYLDQAYFKLAEVSYYLGIEDEANKIIESFQENFPLSPLIDDIILLKVKICIKNKDIKDVERYVKRVKKDETRFIIYSMLGAFYEREKKYYLAYNYYMKSLNYASGYKREKARLQAEKMLLYMGKYKKYSEMLEEFVKKHPHSEILPSILYQLAVYYANGREYGKALEKIKKIENNYKNSPEFIDASRLKAKILVKERDYRGALFSLQTALNYAEGEERVYIKKDMVEILQLLNISGEVIKLCNEIYRESTDNEVKNWALLTIGEMYFNNNKEIEAREILKRLLTGYKDIHWFKGLKILMKIYNQNGEFNKTINLYYRYKRYIKDKPYILMEVAEAFRLSRLPSKAISMYLSTIPLWGDERDSIAMAYRRAGEVSIEMGDFNKAKDFLQKAMIFSSSLATQKEIEKLLLSLPGR